MEQRNIIRTQIRKRLSLAFQILSLSGGGYRGLFTIEILARLEERAGRPLCECFDLIAGTSIGGIIAIGLAMGKSAADIRSSFLSHGETVFPPPADGKLKKAAAIMRAISSPLYEAKALRKIVGEVVGEVSLISDCRTRLLVPAFNVTTGRVQFFKTPHHHSLTEDHRLLAVDVAMATSAAPFYFPLAKIGSAFFADGGLVANSPDACAIHEAIHFADQKDMSSIRVLSVGTTNASVGLPTSLGANWGIKNWVTDYRLLNLFFAAQSQLVDFTVRHDLQNNYLRIDSSISKDHTSDVGLDIAGREKRDTLIATAEAAYRQVSTDPGLLAMLGNRAELLGPFQRP